MKLRFENDLPHQQAAIEAVRDLFKGQEIGRTEFTVAPLPEGTAGPQGEMFGGKAMSAQGALAIEDDGLGYGNRLKLLDDEILANLREVQLRNALAPSDELDELDFTVEMETGTGKTYVYLRTIFELNRRYGWTKFVIVVPSVAIREGVAKTLEMTRDHFRAEFAGAPMDWFVYDSSKLGQVRDFATSATIKIMIATVGALNKLDANVFYRPNEKTGGDKPVDLVKATRPVLIIDEPQSVEGASEGQGFKALREMKSLCRLRYSATHLKSYHRIYRLDAIDAYERKLVKRIDVAGLEIVGAHNTAYVRLLGVKTGKGVPVATVEVDVQRKGAVQRETMTVRDGDDLADLTKRDVYRDASIGTIEGGKGKELVQLNVPGDVTYLRPGEAFGDVDRDGVVRRMIARTITEHFIREKALKPLGIKVLSLFFIDEVKKYRIYGDDGTQTLGPYGVMFEEEYRKLAKHPDYASLFAGKPPQPEAAHDGYFSRDRRGRVTEPELNATGELKNQAAREDAERGFQLIMREKEKLLDEAEPLRFIFSHSALREGWDNPNVFQICVLRTMGSDRERRQTVGRGLRLCVDKTGERRRDEGLNVLTVISDESYAAFADGLQNQIEADLGIRFGAVDDETFAAITFAADGGAPTPLGVDQSRALFAHLRSKGLIEANGKITDELRTALRTGTLALPAEFDAAAPAIRALLTKLAGKLDIRNADDRKTIKLNRHVYLSPEFKALWDKVKARTTYRLAFDNESLIEDAAERIAAMPPLARAQMRFLKSTLEVDKGGVHGGFNETATPFQHIAESVTLPDVLGELQNRSGLTRRSIARILTESGRLDDLRMNPALFIDAVAGHIDRAKAAAIEGGVRYQRIGGESHYAQELFESEELQGYLTSMIDVSKAPYESIGFDSGVERNFAERLNANEAVKVFAKLPSWFCVPTPLGTYNPDWAVLVATESGERLYLVVETKGSLFADDLRASEKAKVACGAAHFKAVADGNGQPSFRLANDADQLLGSLS